MRNRPYLFPVVVLFCIFSVALFFLARQQFFLKAIGYVENQTLRAQRLAFVFLHLPFVQPSQTNTVEKENQDLVQKLVDQRHISDENSALRDQFQTTTTKQRNLLPAHIVGSQAFIPGVTAIESFTLDKGKADNVKAGQAVIFKDSLVGKVVKTSEHISAVLLLTSKSSSFTVKTVSTRSESFALGIVKGQGSGEMVLQNVVLSDPLAVSDIVIAKGDLDVNGVGYPEGLTVGKVTSVDKKPSALFQSAQVKSLIDFGKLSTVFIFMGYEK